MEYHAPVLHDVDVLVIGGSSGAVAAAAGARQAGCTVFCATMFPYFGEDICSHAHYWFDWERLSDNPLGSRVGDGLAPHSQSAPQPMQIKYALERTVLDAQIPFLYKCSPLCLLRGADAQVAGVILASRSGFLAVRAKTVIDATDRALAGRMTTACFDPFEGGTKAFERVVVTAALPPDPADGMISELAPPMNIEDRSYTAYLYTLNLNLPDTRPSAFQHAEVQARMETWHPGQVFAGDRLFRIPEDRLNNGYRQHDIGDGTEISPDALRCGSENVWLLSACADVSDKVARELYQPATALNAGWKLGQALARQSAKLAVPEDVGASYAHEPVGTGEGRRRDTYFRLADAPSIRVDLDRFPVFENRDLAVVGGGTAGAPAGIAAGRAGLNPLVLEELYQLGGMGTAGRIANYHYGNRCGFTTEIDQGVAAMGPAPEFGPESRHWNTQWKQHWFLREVVNAGAEVWFGTTAAAALCRENRVTGVLAVTPFGTGFVRADVLIDATGNVDVAAAAGAETRHIGAENVAVQGTGLPPMIPDKYYTNTDFTFIDDTDVKDVTRAFATAREKFKHAFDLAQIVDSRQRRQIKGDITLQPVDFLSHRTFSDTIVTSKSNFDTHGYTIHPVFFAKPPDHDAWRAHVPYRSLLPRGLEGLLVTGLGISAHRDALPVTRMQADVQNQGYAAGRAAAAAVQNGRTFRQVDMRELQDHLVQKGILEPDVPDHEDSFPLAEHDLQWAADEGVDDLTGLGMIFVEPERSLPRLRENWQATADHAAKVQYARVLGLLHDATGAPTLLEELNRRDWDQGWNFTGLGQFGMSMSDVDTLLVALAWSGASDAGRIIQNKVEKLDVSADFSHFRAVALALEACTVPEVTKHLEALLEEPAIRGNSKGDLARALENVPESHADTTERNRELTEIHLARALRACGDPQGKARIVLENYAADLHGHYARHALALLEKGRC